MNDNILYQLYLKQLQEQQKKSNLNDFSSKINSLNDFGNTLSKAGKFMTKFDNNFSQNIGNGMSNAGNFISDKTSVISDYTNPSNYFKGFANKNNIGLNSEGFDKAISNLTSDSGSSIATNAMANDGKNAIANIASGAAEGASKGSSGGPWGAAIGAIIGAVKSKKNAIQQQNQQMFNNMATDNNQAINESEQLANQIPQNTQSIQDQAQQSLSQGIPTGFASNINSANPTDYSEIDKNIKKYIKNNSPIDNDGKLKQPVFAQENTVQTQEGGVTATDNKSLKDKLLSGLTDFSRGFDENYNNGFDLGNLSNNQIATDKVIDVNREFNPQSPELQSYIKELTDKKVDSSVIEALKEGKNGGNREVANWIDANKDKLYKETPLYETKDKNKMNRIGEFAGSISRIAKNPNVQGLVAGLAGGALTGNPLFALSAGYNVAGKKQINDVYKKALKEQGIDIDTGIAGNVDDKDYSAMMLPQYRNELIKARLEYQKMQNKKNDRDLIEKERHNKAMESANNTKAQASMIRAKKKSNKTTKQVSQGSSNKFVVMEAPNGKRYRVPENQIKKYKQAGGKIVG